MKIRELLNEESIELWGVAGNKEEAIHKAVALMEKRGNLLDVRQYEACVFAREREGSTSAGGGLAIPHGKSEAVREPGLAAMILPDGVDFNAGDGRPVDLIFLIAAPDTEDNIHLTVLSRLAALLLDKEFVGSLRSSKTKEEFLNTIDIAEKRKEESIRAQGEINHREVIFPRYQVLAVTSCPTGIAHTYMAAESLEKKGEELGISIKVETNGSAGVQNPLTREEIAACEGIIVAGDKPVEMKRFIGRPVVMGSVSQGIMEPEKLILQVKNKEAAPYYQGESEKRERVARRIYKHLMNGVSHMIPLLCGGGILIAFAYLIDSLRPDPAAFGTNLPLAAFFTTVGRQAFRLMMPVLAGFIAMSIADRPGLAIGLVAGALAEGGYTFQNLKGMEAGQGMSSGFLGAACAGFLAGYLVLALQKAFKRLPRSLDGIKPVLLYPVLGILIMGVVVLAVNPVMGAVNQGLDSVLNSIDRVSRILLGAVLGGLMAADMGGPINKAAYVFSTAQLAIVDAGAVQFEMMAAVMAGGMVPPLAIALCATFFKGKFTDSERKAALLNYIMGLSFITEGAIPYAAADPLRVLPACMVGSAVAGALSMAFSCGTRAPHGGIFVLEVIDHPFLYLLAVGAGAFAGCFLLALLRRGSSRQRFFSS